MAASAELDEVDKQVFLKSLEVNEEEFFRLLRWSVLPEEGFCVSDIEWLEQCLEDKDVPPPSTSVRPFLDACLEKGIVEPVYHFSDGDEKPEKRRYQLEVPWHRLVGESSRLVLKAALEAFIHRTIEKLRLITIDFSRKDFYLKSCSDYERFSRLIFHALALMLLPNRQHAMEDEFWESIFRDTFFGRINESSIIGAFWYLQDRMEEEDRGLFLSIRDAMLERVQWAEHPLLLSIMIKLEKVLRFSKCSKKFGNVEERKPLLAEVENEFRMALTEFNLTQDYPCIMGYYFDVMLDIMEKAPIVDGTPRDKAWKTELRKLCAKSQEHWNMARLRLQGSEEQFHAIIHHIHAISKEAHLQMMSGEMNESDVKHEMVLKEAEKRYGDHKITATFASFYGDFYLKRGERRSVSFSNKEDDYRRAMQFFMKEFRILQHCDARDQSRLKINLGKQGYVKGLMGHGKEALVDAKKAYLMGEDLRDWRTEGSGFLRYNYLNVIFLHWMGLEDRKSMGTKWWMARELKAFLLPEQQLSSLRESGAVMIPAGAGTKPNTHEELIHNLMIAVYRVQARPRLLSPRVHPMHHLFWSNVVEEYVVTEEDQIIALEAVRVYMETGGVIVLRKRPPPPVEKENAEGRPAVAVPASLTTALRSIDLNNNVVEAEVPSPSVSKVDEDVVGAEKMTTPATTEPDVASTEDLSEEAKKLVDAAQLLREAGIVNTTTFGKWRALRGIDK